MSLSYTRSGSTYVCYYYDSTGDINGEGLDVSKLKISVPQKGYKYIGLINKTSGTYATTTHPQESHLRITIGNTTYALAFRSKQVTVSGAITITSAMGLPKVSYRGKGGGRSTGTAGAGGGGATAWATYTFYQYTAAIAAGGAGGGKGSLADPTLSGWAVRNASTGETYSFEQGAGGSGGTTSTLSGGAGASAGAFKYNGSAVGYNGASGLGSNGGGLSKVLLNSSALVTYASSDALSQYRGSSLSQSNSNGFPATTVTAISGYGGYGTTAPPAIDPNNYRAAMVGNNNTITVSGQPGSAGGGSGGGAVAHYYGPETGYAGETLGAQTSNAGAAGAVEMTTTYWVIGG